MVPRFANPGSSFKSVALYLMHDTGHATTGERVAWTHTLNLAHDDIGSAVDEMLSTFQNAGLLKAEQGAWIGMGTAKPVKHLSLNWHPSETPDKEAMIAAAQGFLKSMGWDEHQCMLIAHDDKPHRHVHLVINAVHPETGRKLDDGFELRRAQAWALGYEKEHGKIFCAEREKPATEREAGIPRPAWEEMKVRTDQAVANEAEKAPYDPAYMARGDQTKVMTANEWELLKAQQKEDRIDFVADSKALYRDINRAIYAQVREECRADWGAYYAAKRDGLAFDSLAEIRQQLIERQQAMREERFAEASAPLREQRTIEYQHLLETQKAQRAQLHVRQARGTPSPDLFDRAYGRQDAELRPGPRAPEVSPAANGNEHEAVKQERGPGRAALSPRVAALERFGIKRGRPELERPAFRARSVAPAKRNTSRELATGLAGGLLAVLGGMGESLSGGSGGGAPKKTLVTAALDRFDIRRGRPPPEPGIPELERERCEREAWHEWKKRRDPDLSRSG